ncbi:hypothetical protein RFI_15040 [Reticulomyxa filosa]|uniref:Kelch motif family protein n=1 Tax=Reticulomyxa filosa TaxID=46433 RepID=X6N7X1_RETFI|nr:hypothetical protein RFI_15040 [Reticulomyxa filosa]|eukprot:ETO22161.1 hypothetical protein RFI_15040 [Reticulomyxa filosa]
MKTVVNVLDKFYLQKHYLKQWFKKQQVRSGKQLMVTFNTNDQIFCCNINYAYYVTVCGTNNNLLIKNIDVIIILFQCHLNREIIKLHFLRNKNYPLHLSKLNVCYINTNFSFVEVGYQQRACYSYHILKNEYKFICEYPNHVQLYGHCVLKLVDNNNQITLLSFGGWDKRTRHTLIMKYVSIWNNNNISDVSNKANEFNNYNQWIPFINNHNHPIIIGRNNDDYRGMRAVISGISNNLLFITYFENNISVFDLNTFQFIKYDNLPIKAFYHCFISISENIQRQEMMKTNKQNCQMMLFCLKTGLLIEYDEDNNIFQFHQIPISKNIISFNRYAYVCINDIILFFGGWIWNNKKWIFSKSVHKYSIQENKWMTFKKTLPNPLFYCVAILNEEDNYIYIIGGRSDKDTSVSTHMKTKVRIWDHSLLVMIYLFIYFDKTQINYIINNKYSQKMK